MKSWRIFALCATALVAAAGFLIGQEQQGPNPDNGNTVARPRRPAGTDAGNPSNGDDSNQPKIPSKFSKKGQEDTTGLATFKSDVAVVTVDVAVTDAKGHFIPGLPANYFRVLEDNVPQQIKSI